MLSAVQQQIQKFSGTLQAARPANSFQYNAKAATRSLTGPVNDIFTRSTFSAKFAGAGSDSKGQGGHGLASTQATLGSAV